MQCKCDNNLKSCTCTNFTRMFNKTFKFKKVNRKVQEEPQAEAAVDPRHQEEEKKWHRLTCV